MTPSPLRASVLAAVAVGGAVGAVLRFWLSSAFPDASGTFPWTIFTVNVMGCGLLALLPALAAVRRHPLLTPLLGTGVLGGFTTYSALASETVQLLATRPAAALGYAVATVVVGGLASVAGIVWSRRGGRGRGRRGPDLQASG